MFKDVLFEQIENSNQFLYIDVRSPQEYSEATIPGAINVPLFTNEERAEVGTLYKQQGQEKATELGIKIVSPKIPSFIREIKHALLPEQSPVFFCWRGGMRSKSMATFFDLVSKNGDVYRLEGGYRAYREYILDKIDEMKITIPTFVLHGMTGVGKTLLLNKLEKLGVSIIDLEGLAGHRGSIFGGVGDIEPVNQKTFDANLYNKLKDLQHAKAIVIEAESKRVGKVLVPDNVLDAKENGTHILVNASLAVRITRIIEEYKPYQYKEEITDAINRLEKRLPIEYRKTMQEALSSDDYQTVVDILLHTYYDPRYQHSTDQYDADFFQVNSDDLDQAAMEIQQFIQKKLKQPVLV